MPGLRSLDGAQPAALQGLRERSRAVAAPAPRPIFHPALWRSGPAEPVELRGVSKVFTAEGSPGFAALSGIDLALPPGSANLVEGPSGSGKTTLLGLIACLVRPTAGRIRIGGREATRLPEEQLAALRRRQFGFVFQSDHLIRGASALDNVIVPALPGPGGDAQPGSSGSSRWPDDPRRRGRELLARLGLERRADERVERLSGGERQRVAIARALINDPPVPARRRADGASGPGPRRSDSSSCSRSWPTPAGPWSWPATIRCSARRRSSATPTRSGAAACWGGPAMVLSLPVLALLGLLGAGVRRRARSGRRGLAAGGALGLRRTRGAAQLARERRAVLVESAAATVFAVQLVAVVLFVATAERLHPLLPGAMCAAGTFQASRFGYPALALEILALVLCGLWLLIHRATPDGGEHRPGALQAALPDRRRRRAGGGDAIQVRFFVDLDPAILTSCCATVFDARAERRRPAARGDASPRCRSRSCGRRSSPSSARPSCSAAGRATRPLAGAVLPVGTAPGRGLGRRAGGVGGAERLRAAHPSLPVLPAGLRARVGSATPSTRRSPWPWWPEPAAAWSASCGRWTAGTRSDPPRSGGCARSRWPASPSSP